MIFVEYHMALRVIKDAKMQYNNKKIEENRNDPKKLWACINDKIGRYNDKKDNKIIIENETEIVHEMNEYCNLGKNLSNRIITPTHRKIELPTNNPETMFVQPTNKNEIIEVINDLKLKKRCYR